MDNIGFIFSIGWMGVYGSSRIYTICYGTEKAEDQVEIYSLAYKHIDFAQQRDKAIKKILNMKNTKYELKDFHGGGKTVSLVCYKDKL